MKSKSRALGFLILPATALFLAACGGGKVVVIPSPATPGPAAMVATTPAGPAPVVVTTVPATPPLPTEAVQGVSPGGGYTWVAGYYDWRGDHYEWIPGAWIRVPSSTSAGVPGHWDATAGGYTWVSGHWR
jgi:hypothetical protein